MKHPHSHNTDAVSPVIGTVLMVAITVILASIVGTNLLQIGNDLRGTPQAGFAIEDNRGEVTIKLISAPSLDSWRVVGLDDIPESSVEGHDIWSDGEAIITNAKPGDRIKIDYDNDDRGRSISIVGVDDNEEAVLRVHRFGR